MDDPFKLGASDTLAIEASRHDGVGSNLIVRGPGETRPLLGVEQTQNGAEWAGSNTRII